MPITLFCLQVQKIGPFAAEQTGNHFRRAAIDQRTNLEFAIDSGNLPDMGDGLLFLIDLMHAMVRATGTAVSGCT
jgi:hypothetical protein